MVANSLPPIWWARLSISGVYSALLHFASAPLNNKYVALVIGVLAGLIFNFTLSKKLVFTGRRPDFLTFRPSPI